MSFEKRFPLRAFERIPSLSFREILEEAAPAFADPRELLAHLCRRDLQHAQGVLRVARQLIEAVARDLPPEVIARHVLDFVRLVEHHRRVFRQNRPKIILPDREVGEKQMMVHDNQVRVLRPLVHRGDEAALERIALLAGAQIAPRVDPAP